MKHVLAVLFTLVFAASANAQINVVPFASGKPSAEKDGLIYCLPRTVLQIELTVTRTETFKGPYADFAQKMLGISGVITENSLSYEITLAGIEAIAEADPDQFYFIEIDDKVKESKSLMLSLSDKGFIAGITDIAGVKKEIRLAAATGDYSNTALSPFRDLLKPIQIEKVDTVIRRISIDTTTVEEKVLKRSVSVKTPEQQAREAADLIYRIEDNKFSLITGYQEVNYSKESIEFMLSQLNRMETEYMALFKGTTRVSVQTYTFTVVPTASKDGSLETVCRFSKSKGISDKASSAGESVSVIVSPLEQNKAISEFLTQRDQMVRKARGFYYRIPGKASVSVRVGGISIQNQEMVIGQLGQVTFLPAGNLSNVRFDPLTGNIRSAVLE